MDNMQYALQRAGLSTREAELYFALLQLGSSTVQKMAEKAEMKRPTAYVILEGLLQKGLVSRVPKEKRKMFIALSPDRLMDALQGREEALGSVLPSLLAFYRGQSDKPYVQCFESSEGILNVYREITKDKNIEEIVAFVAPEVFPKEFDENWDLFVKLFKDGKVKGRELITEKSRDHSYVRKTRGLRKYEARFVPDSIGFSGDTVVYGDNVAIFSFVKRFALIITSSEVANHFRSLFNLAWENASK